MESVADLLDHFGIPASQQHSTFLDCHRICRCGGTSARISLLRWLVVDRVLFDLASNKLQTICRSSLALARGTSTASISVAQFKRTSTLPGQGNSVGSFNDGAFIVSDGEARSRAQRLAKGTCRRSSGESTPSTTSNYVHRTSCTDSFNTDSKDELLKSPS